MKLLNILFFSVVVSVSSSVWALMPPMDSGELKASSDAIVEGQIVSFKSVGAKMDNGCSYNEPFEAKLKVGKIVKGPKYEVLTLKFTKTDFKDGCVGSPDKTHHKGDSGTYHLVCQGTDRCRLTHWNGVGK